MPSNQRSCGNKQVSQEDIAVCLLSGQLCSGSSSKAATAVLDPLVALSEALPGPFKLAFL